MQFVDLELIANILIITGNLIILLCAINFLKSKNILISVQFAVLSNIYGLSILLIGIILKNFNFQNLLKIAIIIILNLIITIILQQIFNRKAIMDKKNLKDLTTYSEKF